MTVWLWAIASHMELLIVDCVPFILSSLPHCRRLDVA